MCCNVLEHVPNRDELATAIESLVSRGGYLFVTVPRRYPYHPGPIDTMFRPGVEELGSMFGRLDLVEGAEIRCESLLSYFLSSPTKGTSLKRGARTRAPLRMLLGSTAVSAVVMRAPP
jgi:hypothetical protein